MRTPDTVDGAGAGSGSGTMEPTVRVNAVWSALISVLLVSVLALGACSGDPPSPLPASAEAEAQRRAQASEPAVDTEVANDSEGIRSSAQTLQAVGVEASQAVAPEADPAAEPKDRSSATTDESDGEQPGATANGRETSGQEQPARDAPAEDGQQLKTRVLEVVVPGGVDSVKLYAGPDIDWAVRATIHPTKSLTIIGRAPPLRDGTSWLQAELADGTRGWLTADDVALKPYEFGSLRQFEPEELETVATARSGAAIRRQPDEASPGCVIHEHTRTAIAGRSPDGRWLFVHPVREQCGDADGREIRQGWIRTSHYNPDPIFAEVPIMYWDGLWLFPADSKREPSRLPVSVYDTAQSEAWSFDAEDGSLVFVDYDDADGTRLKRYSTELSVLAAFPGKRRADILLAPTGGRVLVMSGALGNPCPTHKLTIVERDGVAIDVGGVCLYSQSDRGYLLSAQARWSPDGQAFVFRDYGGPERAEPDASDFWLYRLNSGQRVDLRHGIAGNIALHLAAEFHPDSQSIYVVSAAASRRGGRTLHRLSLEGDAWPGFTPVPADHEFRVSPQGDRIIAMMNGVGLLFTDRGDLLDARVGTAFHWLPDGRRIAYRTDGQWQTAGEWKIGEFNSRHTVQLGLPYGPGWSPYGEHIAVVTRSNEWPSRSTDRWFEMRQLRIYDFRGKLRSVYRFSGCWRAQWLAGGSQLAVSVFPHCPVP